MGLGLALSQRNAQLPTTPSHQTQSNVLEDGLYILWTCVNGTRSASTDEILRETECLAWVVWKNRDITRTMTHEVEFGTFAVPNL